MNLNERRPQMLNATMELSRINGVYEMRQWETVDTEYEGRIRRLRIHYQIRVGEPVRYQDMNNDVVVSGLPKALGGFLNFC